MKKPQTHGPIIAAMTLGMAAGVPVAGCAEPETRAVVVLVDCSHSAVKYRQEAIGLLHCLVRGLDRSRDTIAVIRMTDTVFPMIPATRPKGRALWAALGEFSKPELWDGRGTALGKGLMAACIEARRSLKRGYDRVGIMVISDLANEAVDKTADVPAAAADNPGAFTADPLASTPANWDRFRSATWAVPFRQLAAGPVALGLFFPGALERAALQPITDPFEPERLFWMPPPGLPDSVSPDRAVRAFLRQLHDAKGGA